MTVTARPSASTDRRAGHPGTGPRLLGVRRRAPSGGFRPIERDILAQVGQLPCDVFLSLGGHHVLYAAAGADAADLVERVSDDMQLTVRSEDRDELRHSLSRSIGRILEDDRLSPVERSRRAYGAISHVMAPIFNINSGVDRSGLDDATRAIDAIVRRLTVGEDVVWSLVSTMNKHLSTHTHAINTAVYSALLAESVGQFDQDQLGDIGRGALLHDIGKNRVPLAVLDKPGPLDEEEWRLMRKHPQVGYDLVVRALGAAPSYAHIIAEHHERADGSGYPTGVQSGRVPLASQLVAIADAYDALTSARSYKPAGSSYNALWTMRFRMRGQFNPQLLQALVEMLGGWKELRRADARSLELGSAV